MEHCLTTGLEATPEITVQLMQSVLAWSYRPLIHPPPSTWMGETSYIEALGWLIHPESTSETSKQHWHLAPLPSLGAQSTAILLLLVKTTHHPCLKGEAPRPRAGRQPLTLVARLNRSPALKGRLERLRTRCRVRWWGRLAPAGEGER